MGVNSGRGSVLLLTEDEAVVRTEDRLEMGMLLHMRGEGASLLGEVQGGRSTRDGTFLYDVLLHRTHKGRLKPLTFLALALTFMLLGLETKAQVAPVEVPAQGVSGVPGLGLQQYGLGPVSQGSAIGTLLPGISLQPTLPGVSTPKLTGVSAQAQTRLSAVTSRTSMIGRPAAAAAFAPQSEGRPDPMVVQLGIMEAAAKQLEQPEQQEKKDKDVVLNQVFDGTVQRSAASDSSPVPADEPGIPSKPGLRIQDDAQTARDAWVPAPSFVRSIRTSLSEGSKPMALASVLASALLGAVAGLVSVLFPVPELVAGIGLAAVLPLGIYLAGRGIFVGTRYAAPWIPKPPQRFVAAAEQVFGSVLKPLFRTLAFSVPAALAALLIPSMRTGLLAGATLPSALLAAFGLLWGLTRLIPPSMRPATLATLLMSGPAGLLLSLKPLALPAMFLPGLMAAVAIPAAAYVVLGLIKGIIRLVRGPRPAPQESRVVFAALAATLPLAAGAAAAFWVPALLPFQSGLLLAAAFPLPLYLVFEAGSAVHKYAGTAGWSLVLAGAAALPYFQPQLLPFQGLAQGLAASSILPLAVLGLSKLAWLGARWGMRRLEAKLEPLGAELNEVLPAVEGHMPRFISALILTGPTAALAGVVQYLGYMPTLVPGLWLAAALPLILFSFSAVMSMAVDPLLARMAGLSKVKRVFVYILGGLGVLGFLGLLGALAASGQAQVAVLLGGMAVVSGLFSATQRAMLKAFRLD